MKRRFLAVILLAAAPAFASIEQAPPNFPYADGDAVFVDFTKADYKITYDFAAKTATVESEMEFDMPAKGYPIFDLIPEPLSLKLDDTAVTANLQSDPDGASKFRVVNQLSTPGSHRLSIVHKMKQGVSFRAAGVASGFWMSDLSDREYLEQYLPTNFEFDQIPMKIRVEVTGAKGMPHVLRANGTVKTVSENIFEVEFPKFYTTSSMFFHLLPVGAVPSMEFTFDSVDGRKLPVEIYTTGSLKGYADEVKYVLKELETDYGPFPHAKVIVYGAGGGGMEYSGATMSALSAVGHELFHSYNARAVMPAQGNAGWIDEAMSSWRDRGYQAKKTPGLTTKMAGHSVWTRMTDDNAYTRGAAFLEWMAGKMETRGQSFKTFLRGYFEKNFYSTVTTETLRAAMEAYSTLDLESDFATYIYGKGTKNGGGGTSWGGLSTRATREAACSGRVAAPRSVIENPFHPRISREQTQALLWP